MTNKKDTPAPIVAVDAAEFGVTDSIAKDVQAQFTPMLDRMTELENEFNEVVALDPEDPKSAAIAHDLLQKYVKTRTATEKIHKEQKAFYLAAGRYIDGWKNAQAFASQGKEEKLKAIKEYSERKESARIAQLIADRAEKLSPYVESPEAFPLGVMTDQAFEQLLEGQKLAKEVAVKRAAEEEVERQRLAAIQQKQDARANTVRGAWAYLTEDQQKLNFGEVSDEDFDTIIAEARQRYHDQEAERVAQQKENERLQKEAEKAAAKLQKEREDAEAERKAAEEKATAALREQQEKADAEKKALEEKAAQEKAEREKVEAELRAKAEAERKGKEEQEQARIQAENAPDKDKLRVLYAQIKDFPLPEMSSVAGGKILDLVKAELQELAKMIATEVKTHL